MGDAESLPEAADIIFQQPTRAGELLELQAPTKLRERIALEHVEVPVGIRILVGPCEDEGMVWLEVQTPTFPLFARVKIPESTLISLESD